METTIKLISTIIAGIVLAFWQPDFLISPDQPWYQAWFTGGLSGVTAPWTWIVSLFHDCVVKAPDQSWWYGFCWWCSLISEFFMILGSILEIKNAMKK